jgi:hypothetical protein
VNKLQKVQKIAYLQTIKLKKQDFFWVFLAKILYFDGLSMFIVSFFIYF